MQASGTAGEIGTALEPIIIDTIDITGIAGGSARHSKLRINPLEQAWLDFDKPLHLRDES